MHATLGALLWVLQVTATSATVCMKLDRATFTTLLGENIGHDILTREAERRRREVSVHTMSHLRVKASHFLLRRINRLNAHNDRQC